MSRMLRSFLMESSTISGTSSIGSTDSSQKSIDSCNLCSKLFRDRHFPEIFSSIQMKMDHAKIHSDQSHKSANIFQNKNSIDRNGEKFMQNCFGLSPLNGNENDHHQIVSSTTDEQIDSSKSRINQNKSLPLISLTISDGSLPVLKEIRARTAKRGHKYCKMCTNEKRTNVRIIDQNCDKLKLDLIILHSTKHLSSVSLYSCNICEYSTNLLTENGMYEHYSTEHSDNEPTAVKSNYFTVHYLKNQSIILETIRKCYGFGLINCESELLELEKIHESATELRLYLLRKQLMNKKSIECHKCARLINVKSRLDWHRITLLDHAKCHLNKIPILRCVICNSTKATRSQIKRHLQKEHSILKHPRNFYVDYSVKFDKEIDVMLHECFQRTADQDLDQQSERINRYWVDLRKKIGSNRLIRCRICSTSIVTKALGKVFSIACVLDHALLHLDCNLRIYECTLCNNSTVSRMSMRNHFKKSHQYIKLSDLRRYYKNHTNKFAPEIACVMKKCFDDSNITLANKLGDAKFDDKCVNGTHANGSLITTYAKDEIGSACDKLIKSFLNDFDRLECQLCSKEIIALDYKQMCRFRVIEHAILHTNLPLYSCNVCGFDSSTRRNIHEHIFKKHQPIKKGGNSFRNNCEKFKNEIIEALKKCYQKELT